MKDRDLFYRSIRGVVTLWLKLWLRLESHGADNVPARGGCLLACNHTSALDPPIVACGLKHRIVRFMARDTLFAGPLRRLFFRGIQSVPLDRTRGDIGALRQGIQLLKAGEVLGLFPEGTRSLDGQLQPAKGGIGFLIAKAGVPVVPVYIEGSFEAFPKGARFIRPGKVRVFYGPPLHFEEIARLGTGKEAYRQIAERVMSRIAALRPARPRPE